MSWTLSKTILHWFEIAVLAVECLWQELKGEEPDCPECWKCESMRLLVLCLFAAIVTLILKVIT